MEAFDEKGKNDTSPMCPDSVFREAFEASLASFIPSTVGLRECVEKKLNRWQVMESSNDGCLCMIPWLTEIVAWDARRSRIRRTMLEDFAACWKGRVS